MKAPACDPGDLCIALRAESTLFMPEIAKSAGTPKHVQHVSPFAFFEVGFIGWIVRVNRKLSGFHSGISPLKSAYEKCSRSWRCGSTFHGERQEGLELVRT